MPDPKHYDGIYFPYSPIFSLMMTGNDWVLDQVNNYMEYSIRRRLMSYPSYHRYRPVSPLGAMPCGDRLPRGNRSPIRRRIAPELI